MGNFGMIIFEFVAALFVFAIPTMNISAEIGRQYMTYMRTDDIIEYRVVLWSSFATAALISIITALYLGRLTECTEAYTYRILFIAASLFVGTGVINAVLATLKYINGVRGYKWEIQ